MKSYILKFRQVDKQNFEELREGVKSVETRAGSVRYQKIEKGDELIFACGKDRFSKIITKKTHYKTLSAMFKEINFKKINPDAKSVAEVEKMYYSYPNYKEKLQEFGVLAFELK